MDLKQTRQMAADAGEDPRQAGTSRAAAIALAIVLTASTVAAAMQASFFGSGQLSTTQAECEPTAIVESVDQTESAEPIAPAASSPTPSASTDESPSTSSPSPEPDPSPVTTAEATPSPEGSPETSPSPEATPAGASEATPTTEPTTESEPAADATASPEPSESPDPTLATDPTETVATSTAASTVEAAPAEETPSPEPATAQAAEEPAALASAADPDCETTEVQAEPLPEACQPRETAVEEPAVETSSVTTEATEPPVEPTTDLETSTTAATVEVDPVKESPAPEREECGTETGLEQTGGTYEGEVATEEIEGDSCIPGAVAGDDSSTTGGATSVGLVSATTLGNSQAGSIGAIGGEGGGEVTNTATSTVDATGEATSETGDVPEGSTSGSDPASATGATTVNSISDTSVISVVVGGANEAPITVTSDHTRTVTDESEALAVTGDAGTEELPAAVTEAGEPVTDVNEIAAVTSPEAVTEPSCTGHAAQNMLTGSVEKTVEGDGESAEPIEIGISQKANVSNNGSTTGAPAGGGAIGTAENGPETASAGTSGGATATGLRAQNSVQNTGLVGVVIGGDNYAPINIAVRTVTTIVNAAKAVAETSAGGGNGEGAQTGLGARAANNVSLDGTAVVNVDGDNHSPINIVLEIGAELWNRGLALLGLGDGGAAGSASATGLDVDNIVRLLGQVSVNISGSNYAPIDIQLVLQSLIYNEGIAYARTAAQEAAAGALQTARDVSSGPASCMSLLNAAGVSNSQIANVKMPVEVGGIREQVLAGNRHVLDVYGQGMARCSTGNVWGVGGNATSGAVNTDGGGTTLVVIGTQVADASAKTESDEDETSDPDGTDGTDGTAGNGGTDGTGGNGGTGGSGGAGGSGGDSTTTTNVQVVVAVTTKPVLKPGNRTGSGRGGNGPQFEERWEWVVEWVPLYVIYPKRNVPEPLQYTEPQVEEERETTTSMAGKFDRPETEVAAVVVEPTGLDTLSQIQVALLGLMAFLLLALLKRRLALLDARKVAATRRIRLQALSGGMDVDAAP